MYLLLSRKEVILLNIDFARGTGPLRSMVVCTSTLCRTAYIEQALRFVVEESHRRCSSVDPHQPVEAVFL
jgi:hypothetical protein